MRLDVSKLQIEQTAGGRITYMNNQYVHNGERKHEWLR